MLSFTQAATELHLTQSSISRQIAALEHQLGRPLFVRRTRALELTAAGAQLLQAVQQALATIDRSVEEIRGVSGARPRHADDLRIVRIAVAGPTAGRVPA